MSVKTYYERRHLSSPFGDGRGGGRKHRGVDFSHSTVPGTIDIPALLTGTVVGKLAPSKGHGFGHQVTVESLYRGVKIRFSYAHLYTASPLKIGATVSQGQILGKEGRSGSTTGNCVHIELLRPEGYINPAPTIEAIRAAAGGSPSGGGSSSSKDVSNRQSWLNKSRGEKLKVDGISGPATTAAIKRYQTFLKSNYGYKGQVDGLWGSGTQSAHQAYYDKFNAKPSGSDSVRTVQRGLTEIGYKLVVDGLNGPATTAAIRDFQRRNGLKVDGLWGPASQAKFDDVLSRTRPVLRRGSRGNAVRLLQRKLGVKDDGIYGPSTQSATQDYQSKNGLTADGIVGFRTWRKLGL